MLPFCDRLVSVPRKDVAPVWTRSFPVSKEPTTLGEHLKKKRFGAGIRQSEAARILGISARTLSLWKCDRQDTSRGSRTNGEGFYDCGIVGKRKLTEHHQKHLPRGCRHEHGKERGDERGEQQYNQKCGGFKF